MIISEGRSFVRGSLHQPQPKEWWIIISLIVMNLYRSGSRVGMILPIKNLLFLSLGLRLWCCFFFWKIKPRPTPAHFFSCTRFWVKTFCGDIRRFNRRRFTWRWITFWRRRITFWWRPTWPETGRTWTTWITSTWWTLWPRGIGWSQKENADDWNP